MAEHWNADAGKNAEIVPVIRSVSDDGGRCAQSQLPIDEMMGVSGLMAEEGEDKEETS